MNAIKKQTVTTVVELSKEQFQQLTADMIPASVENIHEIAKEILSGGDQPREKYVADKTPELMRRLEKCRRFLNTQYMLRDLMHAFNEEKEA